MRHFSLLFFLLLFGPTAVLVKAQVKVGDLVTEKLRLSDASGRSIIIKIPADTCLLFYRLRGKSWLPDNNDSSKKVDHIIGQIMSSSSTFKNMKVICYSYNLDNYLLNKPVVPAFTSAGKYQANAFYQVDKKFSRVLNGDKIILISRRGRVLTTSAYIDNFKYEHQDEINIVKARLLTDKDGSKRPLINATVYMRTNSSTENEKVTHTNSQGDFEIEVPDNDDIHTLRIEPQEKDLGSVILADQNGVERTRVYMKSEAFEYRLVEADVIRLSELCVLDDISLEAGKFVGSREKEWTRSEFITYDPSSYLIRPESKQLLDKIAGIMAENPSMKLEVISYTTSEPDDASNQVLSTRRSLNVISYLILIGVEKNRLTCKGKTAVDPKTNFSRIPDSPDKERTEFRFTK